MTLIEKEPDDTFVTYVMTASAGVKWPCQSCQKPQPVFVGMTVGGDTLTCCSVCQRILLRRSSASIPPLSVNSGV